MRVAKFTLNKGLATASWQQRGGHHRQLAGADDLPAITPLNGTLLIGTMTRAAIDKQKQALQSRVDKLLKWNDPCPETWKVVSKMKNARHQLLTFTSAPNLVEPTNNECERELRPSVIQNKVTNGHRSKWGADDDCKVKTVVNTAKLRGHNPYQTIKGTLSA